MEELKMAGASSIPEKTKKKMIGELDKSVKYSKIGFVVLLVGLIIQLIFLSINIALASTVGILVSVVLATIMAIFCVRAYNYLQETKVFRDTHYFVTCFPVDCEICGAKGNEPCDAGLHG